MAELNHKKALVGAALAELVASARAGGPRLRLGLMAHGSELPVEEFLRAAAQAMQRDSRLEVVCLGPKPDCALPQGLQWLETEADATAIASAMEKALDSHDLHGAVALHYPFPVGVTTIGRICSPAQGKAVIMASSTGISAPQRACAMLKNAIYGIATAKALGLAQPTLGVLNLDAAPQVMRALKRMTERGYALHLGESVRQDGGALLRGNDLLAGAVDVCVCDTLTGNALAKVFAAFNTGGRYEASGWGYGPSVGEGWTKVVSIISRASGAPVIANALAYTAQAVRGKLPEKVAAELKAARAAGLDSELESLHPKATVQADAPAMPAAVPTDAEIHGIDVLDLEQAVQQLWQHGIYAEGAMGCTGPVVKLASAALEKAKSILSAAGYL